MHDQPNTHNTDVTENDERTKLENELLELEGEYHRLLLVNKLLRGSMFQAIHLAQTSG